MAETTDGAAERGVTALNADTGDVSELKRGRLTLPEVLAGPDAVWDTLADRGSASVGE